MIGAAYAARFGHAASERRAPMRTTLRHQPVGAFLGLEERELLAEQRHRFHRLAFQLSDQCDRIPEAAEIAPHRRVASDAGELPIELMPWLRFAWRRVHGSPPFLSERV